MLQITSRYAHSEWQFLVAFDPLSAMKLLSVCYGEANKNRTRQLLKRLTMRKRLSSDVLKCTYIQETSTSRHILNNTTCRTYSTTIWTQTTSSAVTRQNAVNENSSIWSTLISCTVSEAKTLSNFLPFYCSTKRVESNTQDVHSKQTKKCTLVKYWHMFLLKRKGCI